MVRDRAQCGRGQDQDLRSRPHGRRDTPQRQVCDARQFRSGTILRRLLRNNVFARRSQESGDPRRSPSGKIFQSASAPLLTAGDDPRQLFNIHLPPEAHRRLSAGTAESRSQSYRDGAG